MSTEVLAEAHDLVLRYDNVMAVRSSSFSIPLQGVTAIIGPNGSGKSTVLHALAGVIQPISGSLTVLGQTPRQAWRHLSYVMQTPTTPEGMPITVREVVMVGLYPRIGWFSRPSKADRARVQRAMERLAITDLEHRHLEELSGGQRQRVYVAQGIAQEHQALLLDEPLTGLDILSARTIDGIIHSERDHGHAVVLTTHDLDEARAADHVLLMNGTLVASGPPSEVLTKANLATAYGLGNLHETGDEFLDDPRHTTTAPDPTISELRGPTIPH